MITNPLIKLHKWHQTKDGLLLFGLIEFGLAYYIGGLAIDSGNLWQYIICIVLLAGGLNNWYRAIRFRNGKGRKAQK